MLLHCDIDHQANDTPAGWLRSGTLASLRELNHECLELCAQNPRGSEAPPLCSEIGQRWLALAPAARLQLCGGMVLLADAGLSDPRRWRCAALGEPAGTGAAWFAGAAAASATQGLLSFAWHLARFQPGAARLLLGMSGECAAQLAQLTLGEVRAVARTYPHWLRLRWAARPRLWRGLFAAAEPGDAAALERLRQHGLALVAAESRRFGPVQAARPRSGAAERLRPRTPAGLTAGVA